MGGDPVVLVTGAGGQIGRALRRHFPAAFFLEHADLDVRDLGRVREAVRGADVVIHLAAMTDVDACESSPELAFDVNSEGTRTVVEAAGEFGSRMIYLSTDYVFDGTKPDPYTESDPTRPVNVYGRSKLAGERHAQGEPRSLIVRTSWVYGEGRNFVRSILHAAENRPSLSVVDDQRGRPTDAGDIAGALSHLVSREITGVLHVSGEGPPCSWAELAEYVIKVAGLSTTVEKVNSSTYATQAGKAVAPRPENSELSLDKARSVGLVMRDWRDAVRDYVEQTR